jgi:hypothetical protein
MHPIEDLDVRVTGDRLGLGIVVEHLLTPLRGPAKGVVHLRLSPLTPLGDVVVAKSRIEAG